MRGIHELPLFDNYQDYFVKHPNIYKNTFLDISTFNCRPYFLWNIPLLYASHPNKPSAYLTIMFVTLILYHCGNYRK